MLDFRESGTEKSDPKDTHFAKIGLDRVEKKPSEVHQDLLSEGIAIFSLPVLTSLTLVLFFSQFSVTSFDLCVFFYPCSLVFY